jgi:valyl-tRNA synthetase
VKRLAKIGHLELDAAPEGIGAHAVLSDGSSVFTALGDAIDIDRECQKLRAEVERFDSLLQGIRSKLANENFVSRAPAAVVENEKEKERSWSEQRDAVAAKLHALGC